MLLINQVPKADIHLYIDLIEKNLKDGLRKEYENDPMCMIKVLSMLKLGDLVFWIVWDEDVITATFMTQVVNGFPFNWKYLLILSLSTTKKLQHKKLKDYWTQVIDIVIRDGSVRECQAISFYTENPTVASFMEKECGFKLQFYGVKEV